ncbi:MAG: PGPGW domain-containing protein [Thermoleophilia bacterium]
MAAGSILLLIGLAGLLLPFLPGWLLIFVGLTLLGVKVPYADRLSRFAKRRLARK